MSSNLINQHKKTRVPGQPRDFIDCYLDELDKVSMCQSNENNISHVVSTFVLICWLWCTVSSHAYREEMTGPRLKSHSSLCIFWTSILLEQTPLRTHFSLPSFISLHIQIFRVCSKIYFANVMVDNNRHQCV